MSKVLKHNPDSTPCRVFESTESFIDFAKGETDMDTSDMDSLAPHRDRWDLGVGIEGAWKLLESGWAEGADKIQDVNTDLTAQNDGYQPLPSFEPSVMGEIVEPSAYFAGEPECFYQQEPVEQKVPVVKIGVPCAISGSEDASSLVNRGLALLNLINAIEHNRIATEVWLVHWSTSGSNNSVLYEIKIKASDTPFDMDKMAFICAHPSFFRRIVFAGLERENKVFRRNHGITSGGGYGRPVKLDQCKGLKERYDLIPDYEPSLFRSSEGANEWLVKNAKAVGIEITI